MLEKQVINTMTNDSLKRTTTNNLQQKNPTNPKPSSVVPSGPETKLGKTWLTCAKQVLHNSHHLQKLFL